ncbi:protein rolling stone-like isoform X2 [Epargyreus clarus]
MSFKYWLIYLTHWGIVINTIAAGFGLAVSVRAFIKGTIEGSLGLPWYVKAYWLSLNIATPIALFITIFYWSLLTGLEQDFAINLTLDIFIHAVNSVLMLALLLIARHPMFLLHFYFSIGIGVIYLIFTLIYYAAGGTDPFGEHTIYPMIDWEYPGQTIGIVLLSALGIVILHGLMVGLSAARDALGKRCRKETSYGIDDAYY